jgi:LysR family glycine cleavage system transcriptional activator
MAMKRSLPPLNGLRAFEAAARHMSFTDAAEELSVTQAAISHQVRGLEQRLGLKMFVRRNRSLLLSEAGQAYLPSVRAAFDQLNEATEKLLQKDKGGNLTVTTTSSFAVKWLVPRLGGFQRSHPEIDVRISTGTSLVDFSREDVDIGIRYGRGQWPNLTAERLVSEDVMPVCAPSLMKGPNGLGKPADLKRFTLLHIGSFPDDWQVWLTAAGVKGRRCLARRLVRLRAGGLPGRHGRSGRCAGTQSAGRARFEGWPARRPVRVQALLRLRLLSGLSA